MPELIFIRHAQASFGAADYDVLSERGHRQSVAMGRALALAGLAPDAIFIGAQRRHRETMEGMVEGMALAPQPEVTVHPGLNEFDFKGLLDARFRDEPRPEGTDHDRRTHFRILRDTVLAWQRDEVEDPPETWAGFCGRVADAKRAMLESSAQTGAKTVVAVSSGGAISQLVASALGAPAEQMIRLQLQMKNCAMSRLIVGREHLYLHSFNETPHVTAATAEDLLTYS
jgi:broad specificity phosphatase PhoE